MLSNQLRIALVLIALAINPRVVALPSLDHPYPLPAKFEGIITIYPDHENPKHPKQLSYWLVPSTARIVRGPDGKLAFGIVHSGVCRFDPDGVNALVNVTIQPYIDAKTLQEAKQLITDANNAQGASSSFNFIVPTKETAQLLIGGQPYDWNFGKHTEALGGTVEAGYPFSIRIEKSFDVRALTQAGGDNASTFGMLYTMKFNGVGDRLHVIVTADFNQVYEHFKAVVKASGWFGLAKASASTEWQTLASKDFVHVEVLQGTKQQVDEILPKLILDQLMTQLTARTGFFARQLKPNGLSTTDAPGGGGLFGWGFSASGGFERVSETSQLHVEIDFNYTREQEIVFGMSFPSGGEELKSYVKNLTCSGKPFPTAEDFLAISKQTAVCRGKNLKALKSAYDQGLISKELYERFQLKAYEQGCHVDYSLDANENAIINSIKGRELREMTTELIFGQE